MSTLKSQIARIGLSLSAASAAIATIALLGACGPSETALGEADRDLRSMLRGEPSFSINAESGSIATEAAALREDRSSVIDFDVVVGDVTIASAPTANDISLVGLEIELSDIEVTPDILPPNGLELTDIRIGLGAVSSGSGTWSAEGNRVDANLEAELVLSWSTIRDGRAVPLGDITVEPVALAIAVERTDDGVSLSLGAERNGPFWTWAGTFELRDLVLNVDGRL